MKSLYLSFNAIVLLFSLFCNYSICSTYQHKWLSCQECLKQNRCFFLNHHKSPSATWVETDYKTLLARASFWLNNNNINGNSCKNCLDVCKLNIKDD